MKTYKAWELNCYLCLWKSIFYVSLETCMLAKQSIVCQNSFGSLRVRQVWAAILKNVFQGFVIKASPLRPLQYFIFQFIL